MSEGLAPNLDPQPESHPGEERWGVILVHGVGESEPGQTLNWFVPTFENMRGLRPQLKEERRIAREPEGHEFVMPMQTVDLTASVGESPTSPTAGGPKKAVFAELYWADLARAGDSPFDLIFRVFTILFRVYYLSQQAARMPGVLSWLLRVCLYFVSGILCGPIAALNGFMLLLLAAQGMHTSFGYEEGKYPVIALTGLVGILLSLLLLMRALRKRGSYPWSLALVCAVVLGVGVTLSGVFGSPDFRFPFTRAQSDVFAMHFEFLLAVGRWCFLAVGVFAVLAVAFWFLAVLSALGSHYWRRYLPGLTIGLAATLLQLGFWVILVPALAFVVLRIFMPEQLAPGSAFDRIWSFFLFNVSMGLAVGVVGVLVWIWRRVHVWRHADPPRRGPTPHVPRMLFHWLILVALILATLAGVASFAYSFIFDEEPLYHEFFRNQAEWVIGVLMTALALVFLGVFYRPVRSALHIVMDIINHFHRATVRFPMPLSGRKESKALPYEDAVRDYFIQQRIEQRLQVVIGEILKMGNVTHLTIIAHSQGTMIAVDTLWFSSLFRLLEREKGDRKVYLMTMGSPVTHLYQHYFPWRYGPLFPKDQPDVDYLQPWGEGLRRNVDVWTNLFRVNDFVGRQIEGAPNFPENVCFPQGSGGGHSGYWSDPDILREMMPYLPG